jgi:peptidoglycan/LPS O-acetylase OafA/YrhL
MPIEILPDGSANPFIKIIYFPTYTRLDGLLTGVVIAMIFNFKPNIRKNLVRFANEIALLGLVFLGLGCCATFHRTTFVSTVFGFPLFSLGFGGLVVSAIAGNSILARIRFPGAKTMAMLAFTFYLTHKAIIHLSQPVLEAHGLRHGSAEMCAVVFLICLAGSAVLHLSIERPFLNLREKLLSGMKGTKPLEEFELFCPPTTQAADFP